MLGEDAASSIKASSCLWRSSLYCCPWRSPVCLDWPPLSSCTNWPKSSSSSTVSGPAAPQPPQRNSANIRCETKTPPYKLETTFSRTSHGRRSTLPDNFCAQDDYGFLANV